MTQLEILGKDYLTIRDTGPWSVSCTFVNKDPERTAKLLTVTTLSNGRILPNNIQVYTNNKKGIQRVTMYIDAKSVKIECSRARLDKFEGAIAYALLGLTHLPVIVEHEITAKTLTSNPNAKYIKRMLRVGRLFWVVAEVDLPILLPIIERQY